MIKVINTNPLALLILILIGGLQTAALAQDSKLVSFTPQDGLHVQTQDKRFDLNLGLRIQEQMFSTQPIRSGTLSNNEMLMRRARFLISGNAFGQAHNYFIQFDYDQQNYQLSNFEYRWKPTKNLQINVGQLRPQTGRQWWTISKNFQMVDRSIVSRYFLVGYDQGVTFSYKNYLMNQSSFKLAGGITHGEGINQHRGSGGLAYSGRIDFLPFGFFNKNGDIIESDLYREPAPKLAIGTAFYHNRDADRMLGMEDLDHLDNNITTFYVDAVFKYRGFSALAEFINRDVTNTMVTDLNTGDLRLSAKNGGKGYSMQMGKFLTKHIESTGRISFLDPDDAMMEATNRFTFKEKYTVGINYFFIGHSLKIQSEVSFVEEQYAGRKPFDYFEFLMQFSLSF